MKKIIAMLALIPGLGFSGAASAAVDSWLPAPFFKCEKAREDQFYARQVEQTVIACKAAGEAEDVLQKLPTKYDSWGGADMICEYIARIEAALLKAKAAQANANSAAALAYFDYLAVQRCAPDKYTFPSKDEYAVAVRAQNRIDKGVDPEHPGVIAQLNARLKDAQDRLENQPGFLESVVGLCKGAKIPPLGPTPALLGK